VYWESGAQFRIRQQNLSGLTGQKDRPQQTGRTIPLSQNGWQSGGNITSRIGKEACFAILHTGLSRSSRYNTNQHVLS